MLTKAQINTIEAKSNAILEGTFGSIIDIAIPVSLDTLLDRSGLTVAIGGFADKEISGVYNRQDNMIYISDSEQANRKAFTVAHELGHYFLHEQKTDEVFYRAQIVNLSDEQKNDEQEANWFAAALLMPEPQLRRYYSLTKNLAELATIFGVSSTAVYFRLKNLGLTV